MGTEVTYKGRVVGYVEGDTFYTQRKPEHFMRIYQGFGISKPILDNLYENGVKKIVIKYTGASGSYEYHFTLLEYLNSSVTRVHNGFSSNYEDDLQHFVKIPSKIPQTEHDKMRGNSTL